MVAEQKEADVEPKKTTDIPIDRIAAIAERFLTVLIARDREVLDREQKIREKALDILEKSLERQTSSELVAMLQTITKEASTALEKIIDLKKVEAMAKSGTMPV